MSTANQILARLADHARAQPEGIAVREPGNATLTWAQWAAASGALAHRLRAGIGDEEVVALGLGNRCAFYVALVAALLADRDVLPLSPEIGRHEIERITARVRCGAVIGAPAFAQRITALAAPRLTFDAPPDEGTPEDYDTAIQACAGSGALLLNGLDLAANPRLARRPLRSLDAVASNCAAAIGLRRDDLVLLSVPTHHSYGLEHGVLAPLLAGCTVEPAGEFNAELMRRRLVEAPVTVLPGVPFIFEALSYVFERSDPPARPRALRSAYSAGAPLPHDVSDAAERWLGVPLGQVYGTTELGSVTFSDPRSADFHPASVGRALPGVCIHVLDRDAPRADAPLPIGEEGHVAVSAPSMLERYVDDGDEPWADELYLTGDLGRLDARGGLTLTGRLKPLIDVGGLKVSPTEVEAVLRSHPMVRAAQVTALPVTATARRVKAVVAPAAGAAVDVEQLRRFVRERLSPHKVPRVIEVRAARPNEETVRCR